MESLTASTPLDRLSRQPRRPPESGTAPYTIVTITIGQELNKQTFTVSGPLVVQTKTIA